MMINNLAESIANIRGANYVPSNAVNDTQFWEAFDLETIDRELGYAERLHLNSVRVFLQYLVYEHDPKGMIERFEAFLTCAAKHGLSVMPVLFDDCFRPGPSLGPQLSPTPGEHNGLWQSSPGRSRMTTAYRPQLKRYADDLISTFKHDERIIAWDLYNEAQVRVYSVALVRDVFAWAHAINPDQPLTSCYYGALLSDVTNIHPYFSPTREPEEAQRIIEGAQSFGKPIAATEILGRPNHGEFSEMLPLLRANRIGWYFWELMIGVNQTRYQWPHAPQAPDEIVFQGVLHPDGTPYRQDEIDLLLAYAEQPV